MVTKAGRKPIHWLEHPFKYDYLRKTVYMSMYPRSFKKGQKIRGIADLYKVVGYQYIGKSGEVFLYELYWLKKYDRGCPDEHPNYAVGKLIPAEAVCRLELDATISASDFERDIRWCLWLIKHKAAVMGKEWTINQISILDCLQRGLLEQHGITYTPEVV